MTRDEYKAQLANEFLGAPQKAYLADMALGQIFSGIDELAKLGHKFELAPTQVLPVVDWPKMMYRDVKGPDGKVLRVENHTAANQDEVGRLGDGWRDAPLAEAPVNGAALAPWPKTLYRDRVGANGLLEAIETRQVADQDEQGRVFGTEPGWRLTERGVPLARFDDPYGMKSPKTLPPLPVVPVGEAVQGQAGQGVPGWQRSDQGQAGFQGGSGEGRGQVQGPQGQAGPQGGPVARMDREQPNSDPGIGPVNRPEDDADRSVDPARTLLAPGASGDSPRPLTTKPVPASPRSGV